MARTEGRATRTVSRRVRAALCATLAALAVTLPLRALAADPPSVPTTRAATVPGNPLAGRSVEYLSGVLLVFLALGGFAFVARRWQTRQGGPGALRVEASLPLGGKERLLIVVAEGERLLIGAGPGGVRLIRPLGAAAPDAAPRSDWLRRTLLERETPQ